MNTIDYTNAVEATRCRVPVHELLNFDIQPKEPVKVSIVIPVCNVEEYLRECLDSAVNQTLKEIEIICVNDGSTDGSLDILKEYAQKDNRVKVINKDNAGYGHAMNIGMDMASGKYIGIIESDDYADLHMYEDLYEIAEYEKVDFIKADFNRFSHDENGRLKLEYNNTAKKEEFYNRVIDPADEPFTFRFIMNTWSGIYNRNFLIKNGIRHQETPGASFQDNGFWFQTMAYATRIYVVDKPYYMNRRDNPNSSVYNKKKVFCMNEEYNYIYNILKQDPKLFETFIGEFHLKRYHNYENNYRRIAEEYKLEYAQAISKEFKEAIESGELDRNLFFSHEIDEFEWIANDPEDYWEQHNENSIKVSVVMPVFNSVNYLRQCLESVVDQTLKEIEIICVDDGSEDGCRAILDEFEQKDPRIKVLGQEHLGAGAARNAGICAARGEYISFLDSDDFFEPDMLESIYDRCKKQHADIGIYRVKRYDESTGRIKSDNGSFVEANIPKKAVFSPEDMADKIFTTFQTWPWNKLFRRHFIEKENIRFQQIRRTNDMYFVNTALIRAQRITTLPRELVYYRVGTTENCQATNHLAPEAFFEALCAMQEEVCGSEENSRYIKSFENLVVRSCNYNLNSLNDAAAFSHLYNFLHSEGFTKIDIAKFNGDEILPENKKAYDECKKIMNKTYEEYMFEKLQYYRNKSYSDESELKKLRRMASGSALENRIRVVEEELTRLKIHISETEEYKTQLILTRSSVSYKIARAITFIPRKIKGDKH